MKINFKAVAHSAAEKFTDTGNSSQFGPYDHATIHQFMSSLLRLADLRDIIEPDAKPVERKTANYLSSILKSLDVKVFDSLPQVISKMERKCNAMELEVGAHASTILQSLGVTDIEVLEWAATGKIKDMPISLIYRAKYQDRKDVWLMMLGEVDHIASTHFGDLTVDSAKCALSTLMNINRPDDKEFPYALAE